MGQFQAATIDILKCSDSGSSPSSAPALQFQLSHSNSRRPVNVAAFCSLTLSATAASTASANGLQLLPVGARRNGKRQQFAWDGSKVIPINEDLLDEGYTAAGRFQDFVCRLREDIWTSFIPRKEDVTEDYWEWLRWRCTQRFFSATLQNFATQSLLMAVGVGARKALAASAAINWMLKDGMNRLVRMGVATQFGDSFDSDLKRFRFTTSLLYTACVSCEFLTPRFPSHFLLLTAVSNVGRAVGLTTFVSTAPAFQAALCASGNMADLASKTQAQHMVMDTLALAVSASANYFLRHKEAQRMLLPLIAFPICGLADLFCIYHELKAVQLRSLNRERAEMVAERWLKNGQAPSFKDISSHERLLGPPDIANNLLPLRVLPLEHAITSPGQLQQLLQCYKGSKYFLALQPGEQIPWWDFHDRCLEPYRSVPHIAVCLQRGAESKDIMTAVLEAAYLRQQLQQRSLTHGNTCSSCCSSDSDHNIDSNLQGLPTSNADSSSNGSSRRHKQDHHHKSRSLQVDELVIDPDNLNCSSSMRKAAKKQAEHTVDRFIKDLQSGGWQVRPFLLSTSERTGYVKI